MAARMRLFGVLLSGLLATSALAVGAAHAGQYGDWQQATAVGAVNDAAANDGCPIESPDGLSLYIASTRGAGGDQDIWVAERGSVTDPFGTPVQLPAPVNSDANDFCPTPLRGGHLLFVSNRGGIDAYGTVACGGGDIYLTHWSPAREQWTPPRNLGCGTNGPNSTGNEFGPSVVETATGTELYFSSGAGVVGSGTQDIYVSPMVGDLRFGPATAVASLNTGVDDMMPNVRKDGLEVVFASTRPGGEGSFDIWSSTRASTDAAWSTPVNLGGAVNTAAGETRPSLSWKAERLYFGRAGDIYVSTR
ncbi:hypothetical protein [Intrasporangium sp. DVR]|uniref:hypothetical protein n=1 Tax=Intrasporangium sp. DVR TaxID=3127867 RepID=UPI00313A700C